VQDVVVGEVFQSKKIGSAAEATLDGSTPWDWTLASEDVPDGVSTISGRSIR